MKITRVLAVVAVVLLVLPAAASASHLNMRLEVVGPGDLVARPRVAVRHRPLQRQAEHGSGRDEGRARALSATERSQPSYASQRG